MTKEKKTERITLLVTKSLREEIDRRAEAEGRTMSGYIQWLITKDIKENAEK